MAGRVAINISSQQQQQLIEQIRKVFGVKNPRLVPLALSNVKVQPLIGIHSLQFGNNPDIIFPETIQLGTAFNFLVGTGNLSFKKFTGLQQKSSQSVLNPSLGINIVGLAEFQGNAWEVEVEADLSQVWSYVRKRTSADISWAWQEFKLADYEKLIKDLHRDKLIKLTFRDGLLNSEKYSRQILEMGKQIFEAVNQQAKSQAGYFRFEPNPTSQLSQQLESGSSWPWKFSVNLAYGEKSIQSSQSLHYKSTISYTGRFSLPISVLMVLDVKCNANTAELFQDLGNVNEPCITLEKIEEMQKRLNQETAKQTQLATRLYNRLAAGEISQEQYDQAMNLP